MKILLLLLAVICAGAGVWYWTRYKGFRALLLFAAATATATLFFASPPLALGIGDSTAPYAVISGAVLVVLAWTRTMIVLRNRVHFHDTQRWMAIASVIAILCLGGLGGVWFFGRSVQPTVLRGGIYGPELATMPAWASNQPRAGPPAPTPVPLPSSSSSGEARGVLVDSNLRANTLAGIAKERLRQARLRVERRRRAHRRAVRRLCKHMKHFRRGAWYWQGVMHRRHAKGYYTGRCRGNLKRLQWLVRLWRKRRNHAKARVEAWRRAQAQRRAEARARAAPLVPAPALAAPAPVSTVVPAPAPRSTYHPPAPVAPPPTATPTPKSSAPPSSGGTEAPHPDPAPTGGSRGPQPDPAPGSGAKLPSTGDL